MLVHRPDPRVRSYLIHRFSQLDADPDRLLGRLGLEPELSVRRALILASANSTSGNCRPPTPPVGPAPWSSSPGDPDPGIHDAAFWLLRRWGQDNALDRVDRDVNPGEIERGRNWFISRQGQTFTIIAAPGEVVVGSPASEVGREEGPDGEVETQRHQHGRPRLRRRRSTGDRRRVAIRRRWRRCSSFSCMSSCRRRRGDGRPTEPSSPSCAGAGERGAIFVDQELRSPVGRCVILGPRRRPASTPNAAARGLRTMECDLPLVTKVAGGGGAADFATEGQARGSC